VVVKPQLRPYRLTPNDWLVARIFDCRVLKSQRVSVGIEGTYTVNSYSIDLCQVLFMVNIEYKTEVFKVNPSSNLSSLMVKTNIRLHPGSVFDGINHFAPHQHTGCLYRWKYHRHCQHPQESDKHWDNGLKGCYIRKVPFVWVSIRISYSGIHTGIIV